MEHPREPGQSSPPDGDVTRTAQIVSTFRNGDLLCERFHVVRFIARGGMGELYEAEDLTLGERVALKTIRTEIASRGGPISASGGKSNWPARSRIQTSAAYSTCSSTGHLKGLPASRRS
jgi:hypothetical protein